MSRAATRRAGRALAWARNVASVLFLAALVGSALAAPSEAAPIPGEAGTDTALPLKDSALTVKGRGRYSSLEITVNQTEDLVNQAVSVTWKGGVPTSAGPSNFASDYLQIMQCWGEPDGAVPDNPGPPPEQCVAGAANAVYGGRLGNTIPPGSFTSERIISRRDFPGFDPAEGVLDEATGYLWRPFRAVTGAEVGAHYDPKFQPAVEGGRYWLNEFFDVVTTNEIVAARTRPNGTGEELFQVVTGRESFGLGCGQRVEPVPGGSPKVPRCWLVVVPRGSPAEENEGTPFLENQGVMTSPLAPAAWEHRIAIELGFTPLETSCDIDVEAMRIAGSELPVAAISSWQPELCTQTGLPPYTYSVIGDAPARTQLLADVFGTPGMIVTSRPIDPAGLDPGNPVVYVPLTVSAVGIGFTIERTPLADAPQAERDLTGSRVERINLTPRLVAKLLTQSYQEQTAIKAPSPYDWAAENPSDLGGDPDFLRFNPEFELLGRANRKNLGGLVAPGRTADAAAELWRWVLADPEAKAWLDGQPDEWGMRVNPVYATSASANPSGIAFGTPTPEVLPKSDPYCYQAPAQGQGGSIIPPGLCGTDWLPYAGGFQEAARAARTGDDGARTNGPNPFAQSASDVWSRTGPQNIGQRAVLAFVDSPSSAKFGLQMARLSRAGDDGESRRFVAPDDAGMTAAVAAMEPGAVADVLESDPEADAPDAYPLTVLSYAAIAPLTLEQQARDEYAGFLAFAVTEGQIPGLQIGRLPPGYAPLPAALQAQAEEAIEVVQELQPGGDDESPPTTAPVVQASGSSDGPVALPPAAPGRSLDAGAGGPGPTVVSPTSVPPDDDEPESLELGPLTPILALARNRFVLPVLGAIALLSALGSIELTRRPGLPQGPLSPSTPGRPA